MAVKASLNSAFSTPARACYLRLGYLGMILSVALLFGLPGVVQFTIAAVVFKFAWTLILPYLLSTLSDFGGSQVMNSTNLMIGAGFSLSPVLSGLLIEASGLGAMITFSLIAVRIIVVCSCHSASPDHLFKHHPDYPCC